jgi:hypothetical protein
MNRCLGAVANRARPWGPVVTATTKEIASATAKSTVAAAAGDPTCLPKAEFIAANSGMPMPAISMISA